MDLKEFGELLKKRYPRKCANLPAEFVAKAFLQEKPQYAKYLTNGADQIQSNFKRPPWYRSKTTVWSERTGISQNILTTQLCFEASLRGVDLPTMMIMKLKEHESNTAFNTMKAERDHLTEMYEIKKRYEYAPDKRSPVSSADGDIKRTIEEEESDFDGVFEPETVADSIEQDGDADTPGLRPVRQSSLD